MTARAPADVGRLWTRQTWPFITSVLALMTFIAFESFAVTTVLPVAVADLGDTGWYSFAYAATITTALIGMVVGGNWADRSGPRTPLVVGGSLFLLGLMLNVAAVDITTFIIAASCRASEAASTRSSSTCSSHDTSPSAHDRTCSGY